MKEANIFLHIYQVYRLPTNLNKLRKMLLYFE